MNIPAQAKLGRATLWSEDGRAEPGPTAHWIAMEVAQLFQPLALTPNVAKGGLVSLTHKLPCITL